MTQHHELTTTNGVQSYLQTHGFPSCVSVERLSEGYSAFVFRAQLQSGINRQCSKKRSKELLTDQVATEPSSIIVKHVEGYAARLEDFKLGQSRMDYEAKALEFLHSNTRASSVLLARVPRLLKYDSEEFVLIMEDAGDVPTLKSWLRADSPGNQIISIGQSLGSYLAQIHNTTANDSALKQAFSSNTVAKDVSSFAYYERLPAAAEKFGYTQPFIRSAAEFAANEIKTSDTVWTFGDFWTGNVLVSTQNEQDKPDLKVIDLELAKPGTAAFDIGQMGAEMLCLARFRHHDQGSLLLQAFFQAYKTESLVNVDAAAVAIRIGAHLMTIVPQVWTAEAGDSKTKGVVKEGFELLKMGWEQDELALKQSAVGTLI